ncbi:MAG: rhomboid family intramembrane serine protease [Bacillota bacterium]|nr:rhomboid family intramembrane serine protease [Bacillota bacterium]
MIPLHDDIPSRRYPVVTRLLVAASVLAFVYELSLGTRELRVLVHVLGVVPARYFHPEQLRAFGWVLAVPLLTSIFLHGGWLHLLSNMLYLWIFGDNVEDRMGHGRFLLFYLLVGMMGNAAHIVANPASQVPAIGASGAIAGVLGAYLLSFPRARVATLVPLGIFLTVVQVPAVLFLFGWFLLQLANGVASLGVPGTQQVAWWAHIGGFLSGALLVGVFAGQRRAVYW